MQLYIGLGVIECGAGVAFRNAGKVKGSRGTNEEEFYGMVTFGSP